MGVEKVILSAGNGVHFPSKGDKVTMEYTGWIYDPSVPNNKGKQFDSSEGRGDLVTSIGEGRVIRGWDEGILGNGSSAAMSLGEKATLTMTADYGYGPRGFPGHIPPNASLVFDVELKAINGKTA
ncbi:peptidyl-prolyl cis-trans isomerase [Mytilinidion resinicola]|uniref:peptidylprolyl isomerase n=1 Tax=Mytilinidion resinicola TaxID=574789 RepID=A0A6A6YB09_9PEZI|nr:peptidyl-prolyl cis-trans isomerase [Mytilinidion resinicola]KAF2805809.1 peptidyl-prolyl cis-trans isomerase [Mytilinidion resinicola]